MTTYQSADHIPRTDVGDYCSHPSAVITWTLPIILVLILLVIPQPFKAGPLPLPSALRLTVHLAGAPNRDVLLAHYYGTSVYVDDTVRTDALGKAVFSRDSLLPEGLYMIYIDKDHRFDFLLGADQEFTLQSRSGRGDDLEIVGSDESRAFLDYTRWFRQTQARRNQLDSAFAKASGSARDSINGLIRKMVTDVNNYWKSTAEKFPGSLLASFLMANYYDDVREEEIPEYWRTNDSLKWTYQYNYRKDHYLDHLRFSDERLLFTPLVRNRIDSYFTQVLLQMYDSVKVPVYRLIERTEPYPKMFRYVISHLLNSSLNSPVMGMDALFVDLARDYYLSGKAKWTDSTTMAKIRENVIFLQNNLVGMQAPDVQVERFDGEPFRLYQLSSRYTIVILYEPGCSHCKEYVPKLYRDIYLPYRDKGVEVVAIYTMADRAEWAKFLEEHQLHDWINVWDPNHLSRFKILYDTRVTPSVYLLDRDKKIVAKKFTLEFLPEYFKYYLE